ncbi:MAG: hypothetical protein HUJ61_02825 [Bacilli bacterium]|nr:hypothetical protein [Bacilli bacterium]
MKNYLLVLIELLLGILIYFVSDSAVLASICFIALALLTIYLIRKKAENKETDFHQTYLFMTSFGSYYLKGDNYVKCYQSAIKNNSMSIYQLDDQTDEGVKNKLFDLQKVFNNGIFDLFVKTILGPKKNSTNQAIDSLLNFVSDEQDGIEESNTVIKKNFLSQLVMALSVPVLMLLIRVVMWKYYSSFLGTRMGLISIAAVCLCISFYIMYIVYKFLEDVQHGN